MKPRYLQEKVGIWISRKIGPCALYPTCACSGSHQLSTFELPSKHKFLGAEAKGRGGTNARKPGCSGNPISPVPAPEAFQQNWLSTSTLDSTNELLLLSPMFIWFTKGKVPLCALV